MTSPTPSRLARRSRFHPIIRQVHLWIGAWGAIAAIVFGLSGLVLNHRFALELPQGERETSEPVRITVPEPARKDMDAMAAWLAQEHGMKPLMKRVRPAPGPTQVGSSSADQPEQWTLSGGNATAGWSVEYASGDASLKLERTGFSFMAALSRLHKSAGGGIGWILLGDSFAIAMVLLGITGIIMWARGRSVPQMAFSVLGFSSLVTALVLGLAYF
ncbi:MAG: hypothetical protein A3E01_11425 [Gammaproteobacteria bacterium RIFCSPHIGHO2_12_FULL_63_22]|nr:MAG: hypothetical protein A3E01_11425 [Gammaproteobacteria bacterium RIFCSPHIGHO2_12_FULL_63_22]